MKSKNSIKSILALVTLAIFNMFFMHSSLAANTATVASETVNVRETADSSSKILVQLSINQEVEIIEKQGDWYQVKVDDITGYVRQDLLELGEEAQAQFQTETTTTEQTAETTETEQEQNTTQAGQEVVQETTEQAQTQTEETKETSAQAQEKMVVAENTKLKIVPAINATDIIEVQAGQEVTVIETVNNWVCIQTQTTKGWIRKEKLQTVEEAQAPTEEQQPETQEATQEPAQETIIKTLYVNSQTINVRKEANTNAEVLKKLTLNTKVDVYAEENGWYKVKIDGQDGYISTSLLSEQVQETSRSSDVSRKKVEETTTQKTTTSAQTSNTNAAPSGKGATVVETAKKYIGCSYVYGASGPSSFDCSGFTSYVFKLHGVSLSRTAQGQYKNGVAVERSNLQPGDLVMFGKSSSSINHVGIYIGGGQIVHAANKSRGVTTDTINSGYYNTNYVGARRVL